MKVFLHLTRVHPKESCQTFFGCTMSVAVHKDAESAKESATNLSGSSVIVEAELVAHNCLSPEEYNKPTRVYMNVPTRELVREWFEGVPRSSFKAFWEIQEEANEQRGKAKEVP